MKIISFLSFTYSENSENIGKIGNTGKIEDLKELQELPETILGTVLSVLSVLSLSHTKRILRILKIMAEMATIQKHAYCLSMLETKALVIVSHKTRKVNYDMLQRKELACFLKSGILFLEAGEFCPIYTLILALFDPCSSYFNSFLGVLSHE